MNNKFLLFYIPTAGPTPTLFQSTSPQYSLRKGQTSPGHQQRMAHQAAIRPRTSPFIHSEPKHQGQALLLLLGVPQIDQVI